MVPGGVPLDSERFVIQVPGPDAKTCRICVERWLRLYMFVVFFVNASSARRISHPQERVIKKVAL